jgi:hypothetical protein
MDEQHVDQSNQNFQAHILLRSWTDIMNKRTCGEMC